MVYEQESLDIKLMSPGEQWDQIPTGWNAVTCGAPALGSCLAGWQLLHSLLLVLAQWHITLLGTYCCVQKAV